MAVQVSLASYRCCIFSFHLYSASARSHFLLHHCCRSCGTEFLFLVINCSVASPARPDPFTFNIAQAPCQNKGLGVSLYQSCGGFLWQLSVDTSNHVVSKVLVANQQQLSRRWWPRSGILLLLKHPTGTKQFQMPAIVVAIHRRKLKNHRQNSVLFQRTAIASREGDKTPRPWANSATCTPISSSWEWDQLKYVIYFPVVTAS